MCILQNSSLNDDGDFGFTSHTGNRFIWKISKLLKLLEKIKQNKVYIYILLGLNVNQNMSYIYIHAHWVKRFIYTSSVALVL